MRGSAISRACSWDPEERGQDTSIFLLGIGLLNPVDLGEIGIADRSCLGRSLAQRWQELCARIERDTITGQPTRCA